jgi:hypothetical protein
MEKRMRADKKKKVFFIESNEVIEHEHERDYDQENKAGGSALGNADTCREV